MSFTQVQTRLSDLFGGAAAANAQTFQGRMDRLKVAFDEGVETIGTKLLPIIEALIKIIIEKVVPGFERFAKLFDPIKRAIDDNKESFQALGNFIVDYLVPVFTVTLGGAISFVAKIAAGVVNVVGGVINVIRSLVSGAIDGINALIRAYNAIPILPNIPTVSKPTFTEPSITTTKITTPTFTAPTISAPTGTTGSTGGSTSSTSSVSSAATSAAAASVAIGSFSAGSFRQAEARTSGDTYNINVTGAFDKEGVARQIVEIINDSTARGGGGGVGAFQIA